MTTTWCPRRASAIAIYNPVGPRPDNSCPHAGPPSSRHRSGDAYAVTTPLRGYAGMRDVMTMTGAQDERPVIPGPSALPPASQDRHRRDVAPAARERTM